MDSSVSEEPVLPDEPFVLDVEPLTLDEALDVATRRAALDQKAEAKRRILAVAGESAQRNIQAAVAAGLLSEADLETYRGLLKWIAATLAASRAMPAVLSAKTPDYFDHVAAKDPKAKDGANGETWLNTTTGAMFVNLSDLAIGQPEGAETPIWQPEDFIAFNATLCAHDRYWPAPDPAFAALAAQY